jgi:hypothetical protein
LEDARAAARELDRKRRSGEDRNPAKTRQAEKAARRVEKAEEQAAKKEASKPTMTFDKALDLCVENTTAKWTSDRDAKQVPDSLIKHAPSLGSMSITDINIEHVLAVLRPIWRTRSETASRIRGRIQRVLDTGYSALHPDDPLAAQELIDRNPARLTSHLKFLLGEHDRSVTPFEAMPLSQVACFVKALRDDGSIPALAIEFLLLGKPKRYGDECGMVRDRPRAACLVYSARANEKSARRRPRGAAIVQVHGNPSADG